MTHATAASPQLQRKTFTYRTTMEWVGARAGMISSGGKQPFRVANPPEFKGETDVWTPEDLFVGAIETCLATTFASLVEKRRLPVEGYQSESEGLLEFADGRYRFTRIVVKPTVIIAERRSAGDVLKALEDAHADCLVANSVKAEVLVQPHVVLAAAE
jgi:peroxiredoxin-like protein